MGLYWLLHYLLCISLQVNKAQVKEFCNDSTNIENYIKCTYNGSVWFQASDIAFIGTSCIWLFSDWGDYLRGKKG